MVSENVHVILNFLKLHPNESFTSNELWKLLKDKLTYKGETPQSTLGVCLLQLCKKGLLSRRKNDNNKYVYYHKSEENDETPMRSASSSAKDNNNDYDDDDETPMRSATSSTKDNNNDYDDDDETDDSSSRLVPNTRRNNDPTWWCHYHRPHGDNTYIDYAVRKTINTFSVLIAPWGNDQNPPKKGGGQSFLNAVNVGDYVLIPDRRNDTGTYFIAKITDNTNYFYTDIRYFEEQDLQGNHLSYVSSDDFVNHPNSNGINSRFMAFSYFYKRVELRGSIRIPNLNRLPQLTFSRISNQVNLNILQRYQF